MREFVGPYRILDTIGRGGMGIVYHGVHDNLNRYVAIKELAPELTEHPQFRERFFSEARTQAQLHHPNIVTIYDLLENGADFFIVMEYVEGRGLDEVLAERGTAGLNESEALGIFSQVLAALDKAHSQGVIHRDVKSSNVLVAKDSTVKLMDFGIALLVGDKRLTQSSQTIGTPVYMSPEQILRPREVDHRSDIYSAGVLLYEMLCGQPPFDADTEYEIKKQHIETIPVAVTEVTREVAPELSNVLSRALAKRPDERFASAGEFLRALQAAAPQSFTQPLPPVAQPPRTEPTTGLLTVRQPLPTRRDKHLLVGTIATFLFILVVAVAAILAHKTPQDSADKERTTEEAHKARQATQQPAARPRVAPTPMAQPVEKPKRNNPSIPEQSKMEEAKIRQRPEPPKPPPPPPPPPKVSPAEIRQATVKKLRTELRSGITSAQVDLKNRNYSTALQETERLLRRTSKYESDLLTEVVELRLLEDKIKEAQIADEISRRKEIAQQEAWSKQLLQIQNLIAQKRYPEAKGLAKDLIDDSSNPPEVIAQAQTLSQQADQGLKNIFKKTQINPEQVEIQGETKRDKKRREKQEAKEKKEEGGDGR